LTPLHALRPPDIGGLYPDQYRKRRIGRLRGRHRLNID